MTKVLVDSSRWIAHLQKTDAELLGHLSERRVLTHPFVIGELALGQNIADRRRFIQDLRDQEWAPAASDEEVMGLVERHALAGSGIGWVDAHLIASALLAKATLLTSDKALQKAWTKAHRHA